MKFIKYFWFLVILVLLGCQNEINIDTNNNANRDTPFYITPLIDGAHLCYEAINHVPAFKTANEAIEWCIKNEYNGASLLKSTLDTIEPGGAKGKVQVGYQIGISLLNLYENINGDWKINEQKVKSYLDLVKSVDRPVVIYLMANHFDSKGPLPDELSKDSQNLMLLKDGTAPKENYFGNSVLPYTLLTDEAIPVNQYRFEALRYIGRKISELPQDAKDRIVGITMAGEVHHMFPDFTNGAGETDNVLVTDYSPNSINGFQIWLKEKYDTIEKLNSKMGSSFKSFADIVPPSKNVHKEPLNSFTEHYDAYAAGEVPISGWLWDPHSIIERLVLYVDGNKIGDMERNLHRLDVYRAVNEITDANIGFRYNLDFRNLEPGQHNVQVVAEVKGEQYLISQAIIVVVDRNQGKLSTDVLNKNEKNLKNAEELNIRHWLDQPLPLTALYYNPLAKDWNEYREHQVANFLEYFWMVSTNSGMPEDKLFSHQIYSRINSTWNYQLFMEDKSVSKGVPYKLGINLYGGTTNSDAVRDFLKDMEIKEYGVPEFHVQQWKTQDIAYEALQAQYFDGAKFISPYYLSIIPDSLKPKEEESLQKFNLRSDNKLEGSDLFYKAIIKFAKQ